MKTRALLAGAATIPAFITATQLFLAYRAQGASVPFAAILATQLCHWELWAIAAPIVWRLEQRWPIQRPHHVRNLFVHAAAGVFVATTVLAGYLGAYHALIRLPFTSAWFSGFDYTLRGTVLFFFVAYFHVDVMIYAAIVALARAMRVDRLLRARETAALRLEAELTGAKLTTLRTQLQPHFLFNTLHTIGSLVLQRQNDRAVALLAELGELLRASLEKRDTDLTPLSDEISHLRRYLRIEEARFGDRLTVRWNIDPEASRALVPPFILQPLVENAFRHGIAKVADQALLHISADVHDGEVRISIYNDGPSLNARAPTGSGNGYGLRNVEQRLTTRQPPGRIELRNVSGWPESQHGQGVLATLTLPLQEAAEASAGA